MVKNTVNTLLTVFFFFLNNGISVDLKTSLLGVLTNSELPTPTLGTTALDHWEGASFMHTKKKVDFNIIQVR